MKSKSNFAKIFLLMILTITIINLESVNAAPTFKPSGCAYTVSYTFAKKDFTGKWKISYKNDSPYNVSGEAITWSNVGKVSILPTLVSGYDVRLSSNNQVDSIYAYTNFTAEVIVYNRYYFNSFTSNQRTYTILHEFGHAVGLNERNVAGHDTVMRQGDHSQTYIGSHDKATYNCHWGL